MKKRFLVLLACIASVGSIGVASLALAPSASAHDLVNYKTTCNTVRAWFDNFWENEPHNITVTVNGVAHVRTFTGKSGQITYDWRKIAPNGGTITFSFSWDADGGHVVKGPYTFDASQCVTPPTTVPPTTVPPTTAPPVTEPPTTAPPTTTGDPQPTVQAQLIPPATASAEAVVDPAQVAGATVSAPKAVAPAPRAAQPAAAVHVQPRYTG